MLDRWGDKNTKNIGLYKTPFVKKQKTTIDRNSMLKFFSEIERVTDTLFLPLSRGIRIPSIMSATIKYDSTSNEWILDKSKRNTKNFISEIHTDMTGNLINYIDIILDYSNTVYLTDITPIFFMELSSNMDSTEYFNGQIPFIRIGQYIRSPSNNDFTCRVFLEACKDIIYDKVEYSGVKGQDGLGFYFEGLFQTKLDSTDREFYLYGIPYFYDFNQYVGITTSRVDTYVYRDLLSGEQTLLDTPSKIRIRAIKWEGDATSGTPLGSYVYSDWEEYYTSPFHRIRVYNLSPDTLYRVEGQIQTKVGPSQMDWQIFGCITTKPLRGVEDDLEG